MYLYNVNKTRTMNEKEEISALLHRLTQLKMELKMTEFTFKNNKKLTEQQVNSILDEKLRIEKFIRILENITDLACQRSNRSSGNIFAFI